MSELIPVVVRIDFDTLPEAKRSAEDLMRATSPETAKGPELDFLAEFYGLGQPLPPVIDVEMVVEQEETK